MFCFAVEALVEADMPLVDFFSPLRAEEPVDLDDDAMALSCLSERTEPEEHVLVSGPA